MRIHNQVTLIGCLVLLWVQTATSGEVSLQTKEPSSNDLINAFMGNNAQSKNNQSQRSATAPVRTIKYRGISLKKNSLKAEPIAKTMQKNENSIVHKAVVNKQINACLAAKQSVAVNINFKANSTDVSDTALIKKIASAMNSGQLEKCYFVIEGHTDASGNDYYNLWLSQQRADKVKRYLSQYHVASDRLVVVGKGEGELLNRNAPESKENRRVVFKVINYK
jgi:outer membrane protein OmpA-like peptidoglycan-associated protein